ncbi:MAG: ABC transporter related protein [Clostridia bacterium 62_21]|nr:MAG: ABC transporter related protein [Clostridia bacterium 62_21]
MALLAVSGISKNFGGLRVLNKAGLEVAEGSITGLVGPNGSGKTTLFHIIFGLHKPDEGTVNFRGQAITGFPPYRVFRAGLAFGFQLPRLFSRLTVLDNLLLAARDQTGERLGGAFFARRRWQREESDLADKALEILELIEMVPLALKPAGELSGGQRKLVEIGRALMADPVLMLLDEPAAGVNPVLARKIYQTLDKLRRERGLTFLIIEHRLEILLDFADYIYLMDTGEVVLEGEPHRVLEDPVFYATYVGERPRWPF